ncbi:MAG: hypothetical protein AUK34_04180 [Ignavibacteria bacterium CG2_30_36_16]|nr:MAG: hypothetical protein AUK34_04180 [Ignavibacteria bacterium CG2_30_36_16]
MDNKEITEKLDLILAAQITILDLWYREMKKESDKGKEVIYFWEAFQIVKENAEKLKELLCNGSSE